MGGEELRKGWEEMIFEGGMGLGVGGESEGKGIRIISNPSRQKPKFSFVSPAQNTFPSILIQLYF